MAAETPSQRRLASALISLKRLQDSGLTVLRTSELSRDVRESLVDAGFLRTVIKGWYMPSRPGESNGETTAWYASASTFIARYCEDRFGTAWCVGADHSIRLHAGNTSLPAQVVVNAPAGGNSVVRLPAGHTLLDYRAKDFPADGDRTRVAGLRAMTLDHALVRVSESFYRTYARDAQIALLGLKDASALARQLLEGSHSVVAGRLAGALRACGQDAIADDILSTMRRVGHTVSETNPFAEPPPMLNILRGESPYVTRIRLMWASMREDIIGAFPPAPGLPAAPAAYLAAVKDSYLRDAYNSLSIEGYRVTDQLIERVAEGGWNPANHEADAQSRDAMAARGYYQARIEVEASIGRILTGSNAGIVVSRDHRTWYRELFAPSVTAGLLRAQDLAGYRGHPVYIRNAAHVPPPVEAVREMMPAMFDLLESETHACARAVLGHFIFVFTHPYPDGNGRMGRFLMNAMLASGGYPWTVIELERRSDYMAALDAASARGNIVPFADFVASSMRREAELIKAKSRAAKVGAGRRRRTP
ncbi:MAG: Fic family protein [Hyphomonadaceae bacterium]